MKMEQASKRNMIAVMKELGYTIEDKVIHSRDGSIVRCPVCKIPITPTNIGGLWQQANDTVAVCSEKACQLIAVIQLVEEEDVEGM